MTMEQNIKKLVEILDTNRVKHQNAWDKVRLDRVDKLFPDLNKDEVNKIIAAAIEQDEIRHCEKLVDKIHLVPAIKLNDWNYRRSV